MSPLSLFVGGEIPDRESALRALRAALKADGIPSIAEVLPDPHYQDRRTVRRLAEKVGLEHVVTHGSGWAFTMNFRKPT